ncbi:hypothetical protein MMC10_006020 [Thelotrema lepadinum]|nr:hypothetical protein [Thelotrema lepadinum]
MPLRNPFRSDSRSERGSSSTANSEAAPAPAMPPTPMGPPAPGVRPLYYRSPQRARAASGATPASGERLLQTRAAEFNNNSPAAEGGELRLWNPQPSPRIAGGAAAREDAASSAFGASRAPSGSTPYRGARRSTNPFRRATTQDTPVSARGLAVQREHQPSVPLSSRPNSDDNAYHNSTQHYIDPAILAQIPAELTPNVPQEHAGAPLVSQMRESGQMHFGHRHLVPVSRARSSSGATHYIDPEIVAHLPKELTANVPASLASRPVGSSRHLGDGQLTPRQLIPLRPSSNPFDNHDNYYQGVGHGDELPGDAAFSNDNTTSADYQHRSLVRMPFGSSSSAEATRSGNSEGWVTSSNLSEVVARPAINNAGSSLAHDNESSAFAFAGAGSVLGLGSSVEHGRADLSAQAEVAGHHHPGLSPFPVFQAQDQLRGSAGDSQTEASDPQWYAESDYLSSYHRYAESSQRPGRMHGGHEHAQGVGFLAPPLPLRRRSRNNPFTTSSGTYGGDATSMRSPYASHAYQHPSPMPTDHRHPFAATPPSLNQPAQPTTGYPRAHVMRSPGLSELESVYAPTAGQSDRPWTRQATVAVERSPELEDGSTIFSTPVRPRAQRLFGAAVGRSPEDDESLVSPWTPSGTVPSLPSTAGPWVSNYGLRSSLEIPSRLDAVSEASSASPREDVEGEGWREFYSSSSRLGPSRGPIERRLAGSPSPRRSAPEEDNDSRDGADSWWSYDWDGDRVPTPLARLMQEASRQGEGPSTREEEEQATASSSPHPLRRVGHLSRMPRAALQAHAHHQSPPPTTTRTVRERPTPRDVRGLRRYLDDRAVSSAGPVQANTVGAMIRSPHRPTPHHGSGSPLPVVPVVWTDIPLTDGPVLRAPLHSQPLSLPALIRQRRVSLFCLVACHLVPPLLFLYAAGRLDWIVVWWTSGEIPGMRREDRSLALLLGFGVTGAVVLAAVVGPVVAHARH